MLNRIFYISYDLNLISIHSYEVVSNLAKTGIDTTMFIPQSAKKFFSGDDPGNTIDIPILYKKGILADFLFQFRLALILLKRISTNGRPDLLYARQSFSGFIPILFSRLLNIAYFAEVNGLRTGEDKNMGFIKYRAISCLEKMVFRLSDMIIVPSNTLKNQIINRYSIDGLKIEVILNGANEELFCPGEYRGELIRQRYGLKKNDFVVGFVGSMGEWQGLHIFLEAILKLVAKEEDIKFLIVGDYDNGTDHLKYFIKENNMEDKVIHTGSVSYEDSADYINACDITVAPYTSLYYQMGGGSPIKLYSYLSCGKPVVISDLGEFCDAKILKAHRAALLIPPEDSESLADAIIYLKNNPEERKKMGKSGRELVLKERKWSDACKKTICLFQDNFVN